MTDQTAKRRTTAHRRNPPHFPDWNYQDTLIVAAIAAWIFAWFLAAWETL